MGRPVTIGAVDVGATKTLVAVLRGPWDRWPETLQTSRFATPGTPAELVSEVTAALTELASGVPLVGIGIGAPGPLDPVTGVVTHSPNQGWRDVPLGALLAAATGVPVWLEDDAKLGALGEAVLGAGEGLSPVAYVAVGSGVGGGVVVDGEILRGSRGLAGEIGHLVLDPDGPPCSCGRRGHVESYAGGALMGRRASAAGLGRAAGDVLAAAQRGDLAARRLIDEAVEALAFAFSALVAAVDPAVVIVGGSLALQAPRLVDDAARAAAQRMLPEAAGGFTIVPARRGQQSVLAGATILASRAIAPMVVARASRDEPPMAR